MFVVKVWMRVVLETWVGKSLCICQMLLTDAQGLTEVDNGFLQPILEAHGAFSNKGNKLVLQSPER